MANDGELKFGTKIDTKGFEEGVDDLKKKGRQATDDFDRGLDGNEKSLISLKNVAKVAGTYIAGSLFKDALTQGVEFNAQIEQYTTSFEVMTGSAEKATEIVERLKKIGSETPFELPQLAEVTQLLMNYGFTADEAIDRMNMLGDISQGNTDKMNRIAMAYGQMSSAGKVSLEDIKQMIEAGFNPLQEISQTTGESMESLYDRISKGTISVDEITASMQRSTSEGGKYFQSMEKQSQTLNGQLSTLGDNVKTKLGEAFSSVNDLLKNDLVPTLNNFLSGEIDFSTFVNQMVGIGADIITSLGNSIASNAPILIDKGFELINNLSEGIEKNLPTFLSNFLTFLQNVGNWLSEQAPTWIQKGFEILSNLVQGIIDSLPVMISQLPQIITTFANIINDNFPTILAKGAELLWQLVLGLLSAIPTLVANIPQIIEAIWSTFMAFQWIQIGTKIVEFIGQGLKSLVSIFTNTFNSIKTTITNIWNSVLKLFSSGGKIFNGLKEGIASVFKTIVNALISGINKVIAVPFKTINGLLNTIRNASFLGISPFKGLWEQNPLPVPKIPKLEKGGILKKGQVGFLEGNGAEAVVPLDRNKYWIKAVAKEFDRNVPQTVTNNREQTINFYQKAESPAEISRMLRLEKQRGLIG